MSMTICWSFQSSRKPLNGAERPYVGPARANNEVMKHLDCNSARVEPGVQEHRIQFDSQLLHPSCQSPEEAEMGCGLKGLPDNVQSQHSLKGPVLSKFIVLSEEFVCSTWTVVKQFIYGPERIA